MAKRKLTPEDQIRREYILARGWTQQSEEAWNHYDDPEDPSVAAGGGLSLAYAYRKQFNRDCWSQGRSVFEVFPNEFDQLLGWNVSEKTSAKDRGTVIFRHHDKEICDVLATSLTNGDDTRTVETPNGDVSWREYRDEHWYNCVADTDGRIFRVSSYDELLRVCLKLVKERSDEGWYDGDDEPPTPPITDDVFALLPEGAVKEEARRERKSYQRSLVLYRQTMQTKRLTQKALGGDGIAAYRLLRERAGGEYEKFELMQLEVV